jgi:hypothetical protein
MAYIPGVVRRARLSLGVAASVWCAATACRPAADDHSNALREDARRTLRTYCAECHLPSLPTALAKALRVFDLSEENWSDRMTDAQLHSARQRLGLDLVPTQGREEALPLAVPPPALKRFDEFVESEIARRHRASQP